MMQMILAFVIYRPLLRRELTLQVPEMKIFEFANSVDLDDVAHQKPPHLDLHCLPYSL